MRKNITRKNSGLSPLARGTRFPSVAKDWETRFIPAGAGNTPRQPLCHVKPPVYPRWRGEHLFPCFVRFS
ncbi:hypothetical protein FORC88_929 [Salmonella enterica subsp. enterica serovar Typhimurium]|nr:hypothetical protein FORC88_929 [Salmonella enterica subsp. enterica serovar Typhimurium]